MRVNITDTVEFIQVLGVRHVVLDAEFLEAAMQMEPESPGFVTAHDFTREPLLFKHNKKKQFVVGHLLNRLGSRAIDLTAYPVISGMGVDPEFDRFVGETGLGGCFGAHRF